MFRMTIKNNILAVFLTLVGLVALSLLFLQYYFSEKLALESTNRTFTMISSHITKHLTQKREHTHNILNAKRKHTELLEPITFDIFHPALRGLVQVLEITPDIYAFYFAQKNGHFYEVVNMNNDPHIYKTFKAPKAAKWTVVTIIENVQQVAFLDKDLSLISKYKVAKNYDPHKRIWYTKALTSSNIIHTKPYLYANLQRMGVTYATELDTKGTVLALDYTMTQLNTILAEQDPTHKAEIFLTNDKGDKYASSSFIETNPTIDTKLAQHLKEHLKQHTPTNIDAVHIHKYSHYYYMLQPLYLNAGYLGITVDAKPLLQPYYDNLKYSLSIALLLLLLALPLIMWSSRRIAEPVEALMVENEKIKQREFDKVTAIKTNIIEFIDLSKSQVSMSQSIQNFEKSQEEILDAIIKLMANAIDAKSPYTGGHCKRVPMIAQDLLDETNKVKEGPFHDFSLDSKEELRVFEIGAWLHDCGKVTTPEYVVDKATKLETIYNRIHEIRMRFEVLWRDVHIAYLSKDISQEDMKERQAQLQEDFAFIASVNIGAEGISEEAKSRVEKIAKTQWKRYFDDRLGLGEVEKLRLSKKEVSLPHTEMLLANKIEHIVPRENFDHEAYANDGFKLEVPENLYDYGEVYNLCIERGTLTAEERYKSMNM